APPPPPLRDLTCHPGSDDEVPTPAHFQLGSMGGFYTYEEMLAQLEAMAAEYPHLISPHQPIGDFRTHEDRPIYWLRISDNPTTDEDEPEVLYTALHHAREPNSLSQLIFFMWHLLENYDSDPTIRFLLDNTELYFVPCVNPDGYIYNQSTNPDGGGLWRKNRRQNSDGSFGVDLNRNYGHQWGYDDNGSSPNPQSQVYRGPAPFSEPETQALKFLCENHQFQFALNYHTYGNLLIYPWGYSDSPTPDHAFFHGFAQVLTRENNYRFGTGTQTVGYVTNGDSDDWMYGEQSTKDKIFSMTPEVGPGSFGFWPPASAIEDLCKSAFHMNLRTALLVHNYGEATDLSPTLLETTSGAIELRLQRLGLKNGLLTVALEPASPNVLHTGPAQTFGLTHLESVDLSIPYTLDPAIQNGEEVLFDLVVDNGVHQERHRLQKLFLQPQILFEDDGSSTQQWFAGNWNLTEEDFRSPPTSLTDSPYQDYPPNTVNVLATAEEILLEDYSQALLTFWARWDIENDYDYVQAQLIVDGGAPIPLCGKYTNPGSANQAPGEPVYDGLQGEWVEETIDLSPYVDLSTNPSIRIQFVLFSDGFIEGDGFYLDDLALRVAGQTTTAVHPLTLASARLHTTPNPAAEAVTFRWEGSTPAAPARLEVRDLLGRRHFAAPLPPEGLRLDVSSWPEGMYFVALRNHGQMLATEKFLVVRGR
ncbi:MAG: T9SS C-terminal target domain-containing protein, partial [Bacteroidetes bacterium]